MGEYPSQEKLISYILGELPEDEQARLESEIFAQDDSFEQLQLVKEHLIDQYAGNRLTPRQRQLFEQQFLNSPWRRERLVFAQALNDYLENPPAQNSAKESAESSLTNQPAAIPFWIKLKNFFQSIFSAPVSPWRNALAGAMVLLLIAGAGWLLFDNLRLRSQLAKLQPQTAPADSGLAQQLAKERNRIKQLEEELAQARNQTPQPTPPPDNQTSKPNQSSGGMVATIASFVLLPQALRSEGGIQKLTIPSQIQQVELIVKFQSESKSVQAQITTVEGEPIWNSQIKVLNKGKIRSIQIRLNASLLVENDYLLKLSEVNSDNQPAEKIGEYPFRIVIK